VILTHVKRVTVSILRMVRSALARLVLKDNYASTTWTTVQTILVVLMEDVKMGTTSTGAFVMKATKVPTARERRMSVYPTRVSLPVQTLHKAVAAEIYSEDTNAAASRATLEERMVTTALWILMSVPATRACMEVLVRTESMHSSVIV